jgi:hypothetical protein
MTPHIFSLVSQVMFWAIRTLMFGYISYKALNYLSIDQMVAWITKKWLLNHLPLASSTSPPQLAHQLPNLHNWIIPQDVLRNNKKLEWTVNKIKGETCCTFPPSGGEINLLKDKFKQIISPSIRQVATDGERYFSFTKLLHSNLIKWKIQNIKLLNYERQDNLWPVVL